MVNSPNLAVPYMEESQSQKHVTANEWFRAFDALLQAAIIDRDLTTPPGSPSEGDRYIVGASATGAWSTHDGKVAAYMDAAWQFYAPIEGWLVYAQDENKLLYYNGTAWDVLFEQSLQRLLKVLGYNAVIDSTLTTPPGSPSDGDAYIVGASATGAWATHDAKIAIYNSITTAWEFFSPVEGWTVWDQTNDRQYRYSGSAWILWSSVSYLDRVLLDGGVINATLTTPPGSPSDADAYIVPASATGAWAGQDNKIAIYEGAAWAFYSATEGYFLRDQAGNLTYQFDGAAWTEFSSGGGNVAVDDDGTEIVAAADTLNFTGSGVTVTESPSGTASIAIPGTPAFTTANFTNLKRYTDTLTLSAVASATWAIPANTVRVEYVAENMSVSTNSGTMVVRLHKQSDGTDGSFDGTYNQDLRDGSANGTFYVAANAHIGSITNDTTVAPDYGLSGVIEAPRSATDKTRVISRMQSATGTTTTAAAYRDWQLVAATAEDHDTLEFETSDGTLTGTVQIVYYVEETVSALLLNAKPNLLLNGSMQVAQRKTSESGVTGNTMVLDRWGIGLTGLGTWTISQDTDVPAGEGFVRSMKILCTTADASPAAGDVGFIRQKLLGRDLQHLMKGTANSEDLTLSFWIKSNLTGTYIVEILDADNSRHICGSITISTADTWESKEINISGDTSGALDFDDENSLSMLLWFGAGSNYTSGTLATAWAATTTANRAVGQVNLAGTLNNYLSITGVRFEVSAAKTNFVHRSFYEVLEDCLEFYQKSWDYGTAVATTGASGSVAGMVQFVAHSTQNYNSGNLVFSKQMRRVPTMTFYSTNSGTSGKAYDRGGAADVNFTTEATGRGRTSPFVNNVSVTEGSQIRFGYTADAEP